MRKKSFSLFVIQFLLMSALGVGHVAGADEKSEDGNSGAEEYYEKGREAFLILSLQEAIEFYNKAVEADPKFAPAYAGLGEAYSFVGHFKREDREDYEDAYNKSYENILKALELDGDKMECQRALALSYLHLKRVDEARAAANRAIELDPNNAMSHYILWAASGKTPESPHIQKALELNPDLVIAHLDLGHSHFFQRGNYDKAGEHYKRAIEINPNLPRAHDYLGTTFRTQGYLGRAMSEYIEAAKLDPSFAPAYMNLGATLFYMGKFEESIEQGKRAISINPNYADAYYFLASAYESKNNHEEAIKNYQTFIDLVSREEKYSNYVINATESMAKLNNK